MSTHIGVRPLRGLPLRGGASPGLSASHGFAGALETVSRGIRDPVAKLRFIRGSLQRHRRLDERIQRVPFAPLRALLHRFLGLHSLRQLLATDHAAIPPRLYAQARRSLVRSTIGPALAFVGLLVVFAAGAWGASLYGAQAGRWVVAQMRGALSRGPDGPSRTAEEVFRPASAPRPQRVWIVESNAEWEQYSNGLRIETTMAVPAETRRFRVFHQGKGMLPEVHANPVGLLFHTTESDIWPLEETFNEKLRDSSQRLLRYLARNRVYHYLVDRFGRVYRVVEESAKANHAGNSVWADGDLVYLNLNHAFLGVSFETRWEGGRALPITEAQLTAGRALAELLRQRHDIRPSMCVAHGLTSINPTKHLIGHHVDWARGFPFQAFGLPDQYEQPSPAVALFGFGYDEGLLAAMGEPWPGVRAAEQQLEAAARAQGVTVEQWRLERQKVLEQWLSEQVRESQEARSASVRSIGGTTNSSSGG